MDTAGKIMKSKRQIAIYNQPIAGRQYALIQCSSCFNICSSCTMRSVSAVIVADLEESMACCACNVDKTGLTPPTPEIADVNAGVTIGATITGGTVCGVIGCATAAGVGTADAETGAGPLFTSDGISNLATVRESPLFL